MGSSARIHQLRRLGRLLTLAAVGLACSEAGPPSASSPARLARLTNCDLEGTQARCGSHEVLENRKLPGGRKISLNFALLPALSASPARDPVFFLAGGPGQGAALLAHALDPALAEIRRERDIVFLDQRGTGKSNPLDCELSDPDSVQDQFRTDFEIEKIESCAKALDADPTQYTTLASVEDLDEVRAALGYEKINLIGASYGTRYALAYAKRYPDRLRSMVLDGVAPPELRLFLDFMPDGQRALDLAFSYCEKSPDCAKSYPQLRADFARVLAQLNEAPIKASVRHPETGEAQQITLDGAGFASAVRGMLYSAEVSQLLPVVIEQAARGRVEALLTQSLLVSRSVSETMSFGLLLSVACSEDVARITDRELDRFAKHSFLPRSLITQMRQACAVWPHAAADPASSEPVRSDVPSLLLSGELDPATPPRWGEVALKGLSRGRHIVVPGQGHGTLTAGCVPRLVARFIQRGTSDDLDASCASGIQRPRFFLDELGPHP